MRLQRKALGLGMLAGLVLLATSGAASANRLGVNERAFQLSWSALVFDFGGNPVSCSVTLAGSFHSTTLVKTLNSLIGSITSASLGECVGSGTATVLTATLPWHVTYGGFGGRLPRITLLLLNIVGASIQFRNNGITCLFSTSTGEPFRTISTLASGIALGTSADEGALIDLDGEFLCDLGGDGSFSGNAITTTGSGGALTFTLV